MCSPTPPPATLCCARTPPRSRSGGHGPTVSGGGRLCRASAGRTLARPPPSATRPAGPCGRERYGRAGCTTRPRSRPRGSRSCCASTRPSSSRSTRATVAWPRRSQTRSMHHHADQASTHQPRSSPPGRRPAPSNPPSGSASSTPSPSTSSGGRCSATPDGGSPTPRPIWRSRAWSPTGRPAAADRPYSRTGQLARPTSIAHQVVREAERWWRRAADAGYHPAECNLGSLLYQQGQVEEAEAWYRRAADSGDHVAEFNLGNLLKDQGRVEEAEAWYRRAADAGIGHAIAALAQLRANRENPTQKGK